MSKTVPPGHILVIDDEEAVCWALQRALSKEGHCVAVAASAEEGFQQASQQPPDAIVLDVRLPGLDGLSAMGRLQQLSRHAPIIVVTAFGNLSTAVRAVENGAFEYLVKPFDLSQATEAVERALRSRAFPSEGAAEPAASTDEIIGQSPAMQLVFKRIALVAAREACVLITGASGTGKELVARAIHRHSARRERPFLPVHVAALNPSLVESELFGHVKGAFTGATQHRPGLLALADGGTVFLDELADIPLPVQVKLLRVLEHGEVLPVGSNQPQTYNIRILSATHQDLSRLVAEGRFRHDLFFRLREVRNALEHAAIVSRGGPLLPVHFPAAAGGPGPATPAEQLASLVRDWIAQRIQAGGSAPPTNLYEDLLACVEPALLDEVMKKVRGNRWVAGQWLGLNRATVRKKLANYNLTEAHRQD
jgi:two-component system nitrogen regulation response regulator GlnG